MRQLTYGTFALTALLSLPPTALGGWISGGTGELTGDTANPWFLDIPEQSGPLSYCIDADEAAMGVPLSVLSTLVDSALQYWQVQLQSAHLPDAFGTTKVRVKTGPFHNTNRPCSDDVDLAFQFGRLSTDAQRRFVESESVNLQRYIGFAARLAYDQNLRGRGFIYIAPETGALRPHGEGLLANFWSTDAHERLKSTIAHEIGHVFGISHFGGNYDLMGQNFPENAVTDTEAFRISWAMRSLFRTGDGTRFFRCYESGMPAKIRDAFALTDNDRCLRVRLTGDGMDVSAAEDDDLPWRHVAQIEMDDDNRRERYQEVVRLWLPEQRLVYRTIPAQIKFLAGPSVVESMISATIMRNAPGSQPIPALILMDPLYFQISATLNGKIHGDLLESANATWQAPR